MRVRSPPSSSLSLSRRPSPSQRSGVCPLPALYSPTDMRAWPSRPCALSPSHPHAAAGSCPSSRSPSAARFLPRAQRRAAEVRAASARKAAAGSDEDHDSEDSDDYYDLLAAKERVRNGRVTLEGVPMDAAERRRRNFRVAGSPRKPASPVSATIRSAPALRSWPLGASARPGPAS